MKENQTELNRANKTDMEQAYFFSSTLLSSFDLLKDNQPTVSPLHLFTKLKSKLFLQTKL
jgi:hypothetical protein